MPPSWQPSKEMSNALSIKGQGATASVHRRMAGCCRTCIPELTPALQLGPHLRSDDCIDSARKGSGCRLHLIRGGNRQPCRRPTQSQAVHAEYARSCLTFAKSSLRLPCLRNIVGGERIPAVATSAKKQRDGGTTVPIRGRAAVTQVEAPANSVSAKTLAA